jgi:cysteine desulfurase/selenocysteine lyase
VLNVRSDFPFLKRQVNGAPIAYLDNAATTQKPQQVIDCVMGLYASGLANVHRAVNFLADESTQAFEGARDKIARFVGAQPQEIIFHANATHAINTVCDSLRRSKNLRVLTSTQEHHSNLLPWIENSIVDFVPWSTEGTLDLAALEAKLANKPDLVALAAASNFLGTLNPVKDIVARCHRARVPVLIDASQSIAHQQHDVRDLDCDFMVFSGHKMYGPSGIGVLYVREELLEKMAPVRLGGNMVKEVHAETWTANDTPHRFEAGTPNIEGAVGLAAAVDYLESLPWNEVSSHESSLVERAKRALAGLRGVTILGPPPGVPCAPLVSFQIRGLEASAVAKTLGNRGNIIVRSGFLCAQPAHDRFASGPSVRASFAIYNTPEEVDRMVDVVASLAKIL